MVRSTQYNRGIALVEILVASAILTGALLVILTSVQKSVELSRQSVEKLQASFLLEEGAEAVKIIRDGGWSGITTLSTANTYYIDYSSSTPSLTTTLTKIDQFTRTITVSDVYRDSNDDIANSGTLDSGTRKITVTVTWTSERGILTEALSFYISNIFS